MTAPSPYDPSTWTDDEPEVVQEIHHLPGIHDPRPVADREALLRELDELNTALDGAQRKLGRHKQWVVDGEAEVERLCERHVQVTEALSTIDDESTAEVSTDGVER
jgi:hypothetical protein